ncbi:MAG: 16S rRNA (adenine(1518)-N(6)/adenine(1519)-N(6))-dimethyltransferase, partial [Elusimicrobia bacterium CG_4_10_14_3_um_filter_49_12_50_7]
MKRLARVPIKFKEALQKHNFRIKKSLGQNFLI